MRAGKSCTISTISFGLRVAPGWTITFLGLDAGRDPQRPRPRASSPKLRPRRRRARSGSRSADALRALADQRRCTGRSRRDRDVRRKRGRALPRRRPGRREAERVSRGALVTSSFRLDAILACLDQLVAVLERDEDPLSDLKGSSPSTFGRPALPLAKPADAYGSRSPGCSVDAPCVDRAFRPVFLSTRSACGPGGLRCGSTRAAGFDFSAPSPTA